MGYFLPMKPKTAFESALTTIMKFEGDIGSLPSVTGKYFTEAAFRSFTLFSEDDMHAVIQRSKDSAKTALFADDDKKELFASTDSSFWESLLCGNECKVLTDTKPLTMHKKYRDVLYVPVSFKKEVFLAIVIARKNGRFHKREIDAMESLSLYFARAFQNIRSRNKRAASISDEARHRLLLHTQSVIGRKQAAWAGFATAVDYSACTGSDLASAYRYGEDSILVCAADITADEVERQAGLIYLDTWFSILSQTSLDARGMLQKLNTDMVKRNAECYAAVALIRYKKNQDKAEIIGCGNAVIAFFSHEKMDVQTCDFGAAAGITADTEMAMRILPVKTGDILCAFTDGISGTRKRNGDLFGNEAVGEIIRKNYFLSADELARKILAVVQDKEEKSVNNDDRTLQVLKIE